MASHCAVACTLLALLTLGQAKQFSTNAICNQFNCINPVFPGLLDLRRLQATQLQCQQASDVKQHMQFCKNAVYYDVALPSPKKSSPNNTVQSIVKLQDNAAATMYYYHLAGMNIEAWEHMKPDQSDNVCTQAVWKMVCHTYFPRAEAACKPGEATKHLRPCKNVCESYVQACAVECCDESVQCVHQEKLALATGNGTVSVHRYEDHEGPSAKCTGAASRKSPGFLVFLIASLAFLQASLPGVPAASSPGRKFPWAGARKFVLCSVLFIICSQLQGCMLGQLFSHPSPTWEETPSYWDKFRFIAEGAPAKDAVVNSCDFNVPKEHQCSGNGECTPWKFGLNVSAGGRPMMFCKCYRDFADPECRTRRKSQMTAYFLSVFLGVFGADHFYLGNYYSGFAKLASFGGLGVWWVVDIVRIGSSPIYSSEYRLAYDLPHAFYVLFTVCLFTCLGYFIFGTLTRAYNNQRAKSKFLRREEELHAKMLATTGIKNRPGDCINPGFSSYAMPMNPCGNYGAVPENVRQSGQLNPFSAYGVSQHATTGYSGPPGRYNGHSQPRNPADFAMRASCAMPQYQEYAGAMEYGY